MVFVNKHAPAKRVEMFFMVKKRPTKARFRFYESGRDLDSWENLFSCKQILAIEFFNRVILYDEILFKCSPHFAGMYFLHVNIPSLASLF